MLRLKELRQAKKQNMRQTAIALRIPYTTYISYEKGDREPNLEMLIALAEYFNCSIDYLVGERIAEKEFIASNILEIGKRIKLRREQLGMSQEQLGKALCFNKSTIQRYENGKIASIKVPVINAIAKQLDVNPNWLISGTEDNDEKSLQALNASTNKGEKVEKTFMATNILELSINGVTITLSVPDGAQVISKSLPKDDSPKISLSKIKTEQDSVPNLRDEIPQEVREMLDKKREQYVQKKYGGEYGYFRYQVTKRKKALGINNNMLAEFTGYKQCTISEFMRGHTNSVKVAAAIANVLGAALIFRDGKAILEEVESDVHSN